MNKKILHTVIENTAANFPEKIAIESEKSLISYKQLNERSNQIAHGLRNQGCKQGTVVGVYIPNSSDYIITVLGILKAGGLFMPMDVNTPQKRFDYILNKTNPDFFVTSEEHLSSLKERNTHRSKTISISSFSEEAANNPDCINDENDSCYIIFTSGSTGNPKAIQGIHKCLSHFVHWQSNAFAFDHNLRASQLAASTFDVSFRDIFTPLLNGGTVCIPNAEIRNDISQLFNWLEEKNIQLIHMVPSLFRLILREIEERKLSDPALVNLRYLMLAGEAVYAGDIHRWQKIASKETQLVNLYGPSETTMAKAFHRIEEVPQEPGKMIPIGQAISNTALLIIKGNRLCRIGEIGEIYVKTPFLSKGYYNDPQLTQQVFVPNPVTQDETDIVYKTGDMARYLQDHSVEFLGRADNQVKINGIRIELGEVEQNILEHPHLSQAIVTATKSQDHEVLLCCYFLKNEGVDANSIREFLKSRLPDNMVPRYFVPMDKFPLNLHGKIDRKTLPKPENLLYEEIEFIKPSNHTEEKICSIFREILKVEKIGVTNTFLELGGDSLKAIRAVSRISHEFNVQIRIQDFFPKATVRSLASQILKNEASCQAISIPKAEEAPDYPVTPMQKRLWTLDKMGIAPEAYNLPFAVKLHGSLDESVFEQALLTLINRHESLRTVFTEVENEPRIRVEEQSSFKLKKHCVSNSLDPIKESFDLIHKERSEVPDIEKGPLLSASMIRLPDEKDTEQRVFSITIHHIISDGWSVLKLLEEAGILYQDMLSGSSNKLPELDIQYKDYATWLSGRLESDEGHKARSFWLKTFDGELPILQLPLDHKRPEIQKFEGDFVCKYIDALLVEEAEQFCKKNEVSLFTLFRSVLDVQLNRYSGCDDIIIGSPVAGRESVQLENQIGFYANTLVLRNQLASGATFESHLKSVAKNMAEGMDYQFYPYDHLLNELKLTREMSRNPLFDIMLVFQNFEEPDYSLGNVKVESIEDGYQYRTSRFDLVYNFHKDAEGSLRFDLSFATNLFDKKRIEWMTEHFIQLIRSAIEQPKMLVSKLPMMPEQEQAILLDDFGKGEIVEMEDSTITTQFEKQVEANGSHPALSGIDRDYSYSELNDWANQIACTVSSESKQQIIAVIADRNPSLFAAMLGIMKSGNIYLPIDKSLPESRIETILEDSEATKILTDDCRVVPGRFNGIISAIQPLETGKTTAVNIPAPEDVAYVIYTSGSTGVPKGVAVLHKGLVNMTIDRIRQNQHGPHTRHLQFSSISFDASIYEVFNTLHCGGTLILIDDEKRNDPVLFQGWLTEKAVNTAVLPPQFLRNLDRNKLKSLKILTTAGDASVHEDARYYSNELTYINEYGPTEYSVSACFHVVDSQRNYPTNIPIGKPNANTFFRILDADKKLVSIGVEGELYIGGKGLAKEYIHRPELTNERFVHIDGQRFYNTGDHARWNANGEVEFLGRKDFQFKIRGHRIEAGEIENTILKIPNVLNACVIKYSTNTETSLVAYYSGQKLSVDDFRKHLLKLLPSYMVPSYYVHLEEFPINTSGKIIRSALPAPVASLPKKQSHEKESLTAVEKEFLDAWKRILNDNSLELTDNFFNKGGDSIKAIQLISELRKCSFELQVKDIFAYPSAIELLAYYQSISAQDSKELDIAEYESKGVLTPIQRWFFETQKGSLNHFNMSVRLKWTESPSEENLHKSLQILAAKHDLLRARFQQISGNWESEIVDQANFQMPLQVFDLSGCEDVEAFKADKAIKAQRSFDISKAPLWKVFHFAGTELEETFIFVHHLIIDGVSWRIFLEDMEKAYSQPQEYETPVSPISSLSYNKWASRIQDHANSNAVSGTAAYWLSETKKIQTLKDHLIKPFTGSKVADIQRKTVILDQTTSQELKAQCNQAFSTTTQELLLAALSRSFKKTFNLPRLSLNLETHGRDVSVRGNPHETIGWFTSFYPLNIELTKQENWYESILRTKEAIRNVPENGNDYLIHRYITNAIAEDAPQALILFNYLGQFGSENNKGSVVRIVDTAPGESQALDGMVPHVSMIEALFLNDQLQITLSHDPTYLDSGKMEDLIHEFTNQLERLVEFTSQTPTSLQPIDCTLPGIPYENFQSILEDCQLEAKDLEDIQPLTPMQEGMFYHAMLEKENGDYIQTFSFELEGSFHPDIYQKAWDQVILNHPQMRAGFRKLEDGKLAALIHKNRKAKFIYHDWSHLNEAEQESCWLETKKNDSTRVMNLETESLNRVTICKCSEKKHYVIWQVHHIIMDGWSGSIWQNELINCYKDLLNNHNPKSQYQNNRNYLKWLQKQDRKKAGEFWKTQLSDYNRAVEAPRPLGNALISHIHAEKENALDPQIIDIDSETTVKLNHLASDWNVTSNALFQAAWAKVLAQWNHSNDVVFGATVSGRPDEVQNIENLCGLFINTVPVRAKWEGNGSLKETALNLHKLNGEIQAHSWYPLADIQSKSPTRSQLFDHILIFENFPETDFSNESDNKMFDIKSISLDDPIHYDLGMMIIPAKETIRIRAMAKAEIYDATFVRSILNSYESVLREMVSDQTDSKQDLVMNEVQQNRVHLHLSATFTVDLIEDSLRYFEKLLLHECELSFAPLNTVIQDLITPVNAKTDIPIFRSILIRREDWAGITQNENEARKNVEHNKTDFIQALRQASDRGENTIVFICPDNPQSTLFHDSLAAKQLGESINDIPKVELINCHDLLKDLPADKIYDAQAYNIAQIPYTEIMYSAFASQIWRVMDRCIRNPIKAISVDCDNTLWQGIAGDDELKALRLDPSNHSLQNLLKEKRDAGLFLGINSKNDPETVHNVFMNRTDFPVKLSDFNNQKINWQPKSQNLIKQAAELNIGLDSFVFIDDSKVECSEVREQLAEVKVLNWTENENRKHILKNYWPLDTGKTTVEDKNRADVMQMESERKKLLSRTLHYNDFLSNLEMKFEINELENENISRASQMTLRTNQFNSTTIRRTEHEIQQLLDQKQYKVFSLKLKDRFSDYGIVSLMIIQVTEKSLEIESFVLSCRAFSRGIEHKFLSEVAKRLKTSNLREIRIHCQKTERNQPFYNFLESLPGRSANDFQSKALTVQEAENLNFQPDQISIDNSNKKKIEYKKPSPNLLDHRARNAAYSLIAHKLNSPESIHTATDLYHKEIEKIKSTSFSGERTYTAPTNENEEKLQRIWEEVLQVERIGIEENFFMLGGHSLSAVQIISRCSRLFSHDFDLNLFFVEPTIQAMARKIDNTKGEDLNSLLDELGELEDTELEDLMDDFELQNN